MKKIAITSSLGVKDNKTNTAYTEAFSTPKTIPFIIPTIVNEINEIVTKEKEEEYKTKAKEIAEMSDCLILTGGADINPVMYGKENEGSESCNSQRDRSDMYLTKAFIEQSKPIMGICRGMQILGLTFKIPNFKQDLGETNEFHNGANNDLTSRQEFAHRISLKEDLMEYINESSMLVNSFHHQGFQFFKTKKGDKWETDTPTAIAKIEEKTDIKILAHTTNVIEAFKHKTLPIFAVQWHPEEYGNKSVIINYFLTKYINN